VELIARLKSELRAWLIDLVREAIRDQRIEDMLREESTRPIYPGKLGPFKTSKPASKPETAPVYEPSFERMEAEAIQDQEKYYEPAPRV
jgi:hypothetical protein